MHDNLNNFWDIMASMIKLNINMRDMEPGEWCPSLSILFYTNVWMYTSTFDYRRLRHLRVEMRLSGLINKGDINVLAKFLSQYFYFNYAVITSIVISILL